MPVTCYSQRILNPFRGVMNIISIGNALPADKMHSLYPKIINQRAINAARVEAMMRRSNQKKRKDDAAESIEFAETQHALI